MENIIDKEVDKKLVAISTDVVEQQKTATKLAVVKSEKDFTKATEFLVLIKGRLKRIKEIKDETVKPIKDGVKALEARFKEQENPLLEAEQEVKIGMNNYSREQEEIARKEEQRLRVLQEKREEKAKEKGKPIDIVPTVTVERREATVKTETGSATTKKVWKGEILDIHTLPKKYKDAILEKALERGVAEVVINGAVRSGVRDITGVRIFEDFDVSVRV